LLVAVLGPPWAASAHPVRETDTFSYVFTLAAGQVCDFPLRESATVTVSVLRLTDRSGDAIREVEHSTISIRHTNLATGYRLTESEPLNSVRWLDSNKGSTMGIQWHLRDPDGKVVLTVGGRFTYTLEPFDILSITPRVEQYQDGAQVLCTLLGGSPA
jgi:hypothetical protein